MLQLRRILFLVLCFSLCLTVCVLPVSAADFVYGDGFFYWEQGTSLIFTNSGTGSYYGQSNSVDVLSGYFPATFSVTEDDYGDQTYLVLGSLLPKFPGQNVISLSTVDQFYVEFLFALPGPVTFERTEPYAGNLSARIGVGKNELNTSYTGSSVYAEDAAQVIDGNLVPLVSTSSGYFELLSGKYEASRYWGYRFYFNPLSISTASSDELVFKFYVKDSNSYVFSDPNYDKGIYDEVTVNTGILQEINGTLTEIQVSTSQMLEGISDIKDTVTDTSEQLQNPSSNIWQAAGSAISNTIESLFVPSTDDITEVKQGFDDLAKDKLGGAYTAMETVDDTFTQLNDKLNNPSAAEGVEFPGISVPLGGELGTVTLAEKQMVVLPTAMTAVLHPLAGTIVSIICGLGTFNVLKDMVECFLSGYSFAEYLHRNKGGSDE